MASLPPPPLQDGGGGRGRRDRAAPQALCSASSHRPCQTARPRSCSLRPNAFYLLFSLTLLGFLPAASSWPGWRDEANVHEALPQAIPPLPVVQEQEPQRHWALEARRDSEGPGLCPGNPQAQPGHRHRSMRLPFLPTRPLHICVSFCFSFWGWAFWGAVSESTSKDGSIRPTYCGWWTSVGGRAFVY